MGFKNEQSIHKQITATIKIIMSHHRTCFKLVRPSTNRHNIVPQINLPEKRIHRWRRVFYKWYIPWPCSAWVVDPCPGHWGRSAGVVGLEKTCCSWEARYATECCLLRALILPQCDHMTTADTWPGWVTWMKRWYWINASKQNPCVIICSCHVCIQKYMIKRTESSQRTSFQKKYKVWNEYSMRSAITQNSSR